MPLAIVPPAKSPGIEASRPAVAAAPAWSGPIFIVGMPRSGTKLLRGLLGQHPRIRIPDIETDFLPFLLQWVRRHGEPRTDAELQRLYQRLERTTYFTLRRAAERFDWRKWRACCGGRCDAAGLFEGFIRYETGMPPLGDPDAERTDSPIWGDKSPSYIRHIELLLKCFPDARIVHIVRDVRDQCISIRKAWGKDMRRAAYQWGEDVARAHALCRAERSRCIELKYEDLLLHPERQMAVLSEFLNVDYRQAMTRLGRAAENLGDATGQVEIVRDNFSKFSARLTPREIVAIESLSLQTMRQLDYEPVYATQQRRLGTIELGLRRVKDGFSLVFGQARKRGLLNALRFHASHSSLTRTS